MVAEGYKGPHQNLLPLHWWLQVGGGSVTHPPVPPPPPPPVKTENQPSQFLATQEGLWGLRTWMGMAVVPYPFSSVDCGQVAESFQALVPLLQKWGNDSSLFIG